MKCLDLVATEIWVSVSDSGKNLKTWDFEIRKSINPGKPVFSVFEKKQYLLTI